MSPNVQDLGFFAEVCFVLAYFAGAQRQTSFLAAAIRPLTAVLFHNEAKDRGSEVSDKNDFEGVDGFRQWALAVYMIHPLIRRTFMPVAAECILFASLGPVFYI